MRCGWCIWMRRGAQGESKHVSCWQVGICIGGEGKGEMGAPGSKVLLRTMAVNLLPCTETWAMRKLI